MLCSYITMMTEWIPPIICSGAYAVGTSSMHASQTYITQLLAMFIIYLFIRLYSSKAEGL